MIQSQSPDQYTRQVHANIDRDLAAMQRSAETERLKQRGRELAGYQQRDMRSSGQGFIWQQTQAPVWPARMPEQLRTQIEAAIAAERAARAAFDGQVLQFRMWQQGHPSASEELQRLEYERLTIDAQAAGERAAQTLEGAMLALGGLAHVVEALEQAERSAPGRRAAADRAHEQALAAIENDISTAKSAAMRLGVQV